MAKTTYEVHVIDGISMEKFTYCSEDKAKFIRLIGQMMGWEVFVYQSTTFR